jgi:hypothetical protein
MNAVEDILLKEGYTSAESLIKDTSYLFALARIEQYKAECEFYENKYRTKVKKFEQSLHKKVGKEDFQKEEDLEDWEFAVAALAWWTEKAKELKK